MPTIDPDVGRRLSETPEFEPRCLRVVMEQAMLPETQRNRKRHAVEAEIDAQLEAAVAFRLPASPEATFVRFDCRVLGCTAACGANDFGDLSTNPEAVKGTQWLPNCIEPQ